MTSGTAGRWAIAAVSAAAVGTAGVGLAATKPPTKLSLKAEPGGDVKFTKSKLMTSARRVTLVMKNPGSSGLAHGVAVDGHGIDRKGKVVAPGKTSKVTVSVKPGKYTFYCPEEGHRAAGMKGKLIVK